MRSGTGRPDCAGTAAHSGPAQPACWPRGAPPAWSPVATSGGGGCGRHPGGLRELAEDVTGLEERVAEPEGAPLGPGGDHVFGRTARGGP